MALARLAMVKDMLGVSLTTTTYDDVIKSYLSASTVAFESACDRSLELSKHNEYYTVESVDTSKYLYLKNTPIVSVYLVSTSTANLEVYELACLEIDKSLALAAEKGYGVDFVNDRIKKLVGSILRGEVNGR